MQSKLISHAQRGKKEMRDLRAELEAELAATRAELERQRAQAEVAKQQALERLRVELTGSAHDRERVRQEKEREERVEMLRRQIARRILNQDLVRGWSAWHELWETLTSERRTMRRVTGKLTKPGLTACFGYWRDDWRVC